MMKIIIKQMSDKLMGYINEKGGQIQVTPEWTNNWLKENGGEDEVTNTDDKTGNVISGASVTIKKKVGA